MSREDVLTKHVLARILHSDGRRSQQREGLSSASSQPPCGESPAAGNWVTVSQSMAPESWPKGSWPAPQTTHKWGNLLLAAGKSASPNSQCHRWATAGFSVLTVPRT